MTLKSIHHDDDGKYGSAVYFCEVRGDATDEWIVDLFPRAYGNNVTAFNVTRPSGCVRWYMLIVNKRQTTRADIVNRLRDRGVPNDDFTVEVCAGLSGVGEATRVGTSRTGTARALKNAAHHVGITAR